MPSVFTNLLNNISQIFQSKTKQKKSKSKTKLKSEDIHNPQESVDFLRALADRIESGDFAGPHQEGARRVDGTPKFECDIDLKEAVQKEEIKTSVKIKMEWVDALEEQSVQRLKDEDFFSMKEEYLRSLDEDDLLIVSQKMLHVLKKEHKDHDQAPRKSKQCDVREVESKKSQVSKAQTDIPKTKTEGARGKSKASENKRQGVSKKSTSPTESSVS